MASTLNKRLIISHLLVALVSIALVFAFSGRTIYQAAQEQTEHRMEDLAFAASNALEDPLEELFEGEASLASVQSIVAHWLADETDLYYAVFLPDGTPIIDNEGTSASPPSAAAAPEVFLAIQNKLGEADIIRTNENDIETIYTAVRIEHGDEVLGVLRLGSPLQKALAPARNSLNTLFAFTILITGGVGIAGWMLARNLAKPIEHLTRTAQKLSHGNLKARAIPTGPGELHRLAETFNSMAVRLQANVNKLQDFVDNASHELRTPLTTIKLRVEALRTGVDDPQLSQRFLLEIENEVDRLTQMVNDLLDISRIEAERDTAEHTWVDLATLAAETCDIFSIRAQKAHIQLTSTTSPDIPPILAKEDQLRRVLDNLVANALAHTPEKGQVSLHLYPSENGHWVQIEISDTGSGIAPKHLIHIFERFYRVDRTRPRGKRPRGTGLGLAIVKSIIEAHGGEITAASEVGAGTTFHIKLPLPEHSIKEKSHRK